jgi:serine phosphatase RsbU (regulator of sigma subunit)
MAASIVATDQRVAQSSAGAAHVIRSLAVVLMVAYLATLTATILRLAGGASYGFLAYRAPRAADGLVVFNTGLFVPAGFATLQSGDRILAVDGVSARAGAAFESTFWRSRRPGDYFTLRVHPAGVANPSANKEVRIALYAPLAHSDVLSEVIVIGFETLVLAIVTVGVVLLRPRLPAARLLLLWGAAVSFSALCAMSTPVPTNLWPWACLLGYILETLSLVALLHLFLIFPEPSPLIARLQPMTSAWPRRVGLMLLAYVIPLGVMAAIMAGPPSLWNQEVPIVQVPLLLAIVVAIARSYVRPPTPLARAQITWILWALALAVTVAVTTTLVGIALPGRPPAVNTIGVVVFATSWTLVPVAFGFAVLRYRLFDVDRVVRATITYGLLTAILVAAYLIVAFAFGQVVRAISGSGAATDPTIAVVAALIVGLLGQQTHRRLGTLLDRLVYRDRLARRRFLEESVTVLGRAASLESVMAFLTTHAAQRLELSGAWVLLPGNPDVPPSAVAPSGPFLSGLQRLAGPAVLLPSNVPAGAMPVLAADDPAAAPWYAAGAQVVVPLRARTAQNGGDSRASPMESEQFIGAWVLGQRRSRELPERDDLAVLAQVGQQAALLLEYARLGREQVHQALAQQDLSRARDIQRRMLPDNRDSRYLGWPGVMEIAWRFQPARETSGDFYDVFQLPAGTGRPEGEYAPIQLTVGDVQGKSIGAALVMALAQATLRTASYARAERSPATTLRLAAELLHKQNAEQDYVACALAIVEPTYSGEGPIGLCLHLANAAQIPPLLCRKGQAIELEPSGERLPLGTLAHPAYEDLTVALEPGDIVVFASDGVPEAVRRGNERAGVKSTSFFGFQRLAESATRWAARSASADTVASGIWSDVMAWLGDAPLHDDMTLLVLRCMPSLATDQVAYEVRGDSDDR